MYINLHAIAQINMYQSLSSVLVDFKYGLGLNKIFSYSFYFTNNLQKKLSVQQYR